MAGAQPSYGLALSLANSSAAGANPFEEDGTDFNFGNDDNPNMSGSQNPSTTASSTATAAEGGGSAGSTSATGTPASSGGAADASADFLGLSPMVIIIGLVLLAVLYLVQKHDIKL